MIQANEIAAAFGLPCLLSGDMQTALQLWEDLYQNRANWQKERVKPLRLPAMIARELKRLAWTRKTQNYSCPYSIPNKCCGRSWITALHPVGCC